MAKLGLRRTAGGREIAGSNPAVPTQEQLFHHIVAEVGANGIVALVCCCGEWMRGESASEVADQFEEHRGRVFATVQRQDKERRSL